MMHKLKLFLNTSRNTNKINCIWIKNTSIFVNLLLLNPSPYGGRSTSFFRSKLQIESDSVGRTDSSRNHVLATEDPGEPDDICHRNNCLSLRKHTSHEDSLCTQTAKLPFPSFMYLWSRYASRHTPTKTERKKWRIDQFPESTEKRYRCRWRTRRLLRLEDWHFGSVIQIG